MGLLDDYSGSSMAYSGFSLFSSPYYDLVFGQPMINQVECRLIGYISFSKKRFWGLKEIEDGEYSMPDDAVQVGLKELTNIVQE